MFENPPNISGTLIQIPKASCMKLSSRQEKKAIIESWSIEVCIDAFVSTANKDLTAFGFPPVSPATHGKALSGFSLLMLFSFQYLNHLVTHILGNLSHLDSIFLVNIIVNHHSLKPLKYLFSRINYRSRTNKVELCSQISLNSVLTAWWRFGKPKTCRRDQQARDWAKSYRWRENTSPLKIPSLPMVVTTLGLRLPPKGTHM